MKKYAIWDKKTPIITPIMEVLTPEQWIERYPVAALDHITVICSAGEINGGFFGTLSQLVQTYESQGCDFSACVTPEEKLAAIEAFDDAKEIAAREAAEAAKAQAEAEAMNAEVSAMSLASIAAQLEFQNMMMLPDEEDY